MSAFTELLKQSREFNAVCDALRVGRAPLGVLGLANAQKAHWISAICETLEKPAVVLCPDENAASRLCEDLNAFAGGAFVYPARDFHFRTEDSASREYEQLRIGALSNFLSGKAKFLVTTAQAACQYTVPRASLRANTVVLREGEDCRLEQTVKTLLAAGYARVEQVDNIGQLSLRGGILDFFMPDAGDGDSVCVR